MTSGNTYPQTIDAGIVVRLSMMMEGTEVSLQGVPGAIGAS
jgi:hypothetical protein